MPAPTTFDPGTPTLPHTIHVGGPAATTDLPKRVVERLETLRERVSDLHRILPLSEERSAASTAKVEAELRLKRLLDHPHQGGFGLAELDTRVVQQKRLLAELTQAAQRLTDRYTRSHTQWNSSAQVLRSVEDWLRGRPGGTTLADLEIEPPKLGKGESLIDAIDRHRRKASELATELHKIQTRPYPSNYAKQRMKEQVETLARAPSVALLLGQDREVVWPRTTFQAMVFNSATPTFAGTEVTDMLGLFAWTFKDQLIKRLEAEIDAAADDKAALSLADRERQAAEIEAALLETERAESSLVWVALDAGLPVEHRANCSAMAILGCQLITVAG